MHLVKACSFERRVACDLRYVLVAAVLLLLDVIQELCAHHRTGVEATPAIPVHVCGYIMVNV